MTVIAVENQKGGAGKTTVAVCLATALMKDGLDVQLVDSDPQGSSSDWHAAAELAGFEPVKTCQITRPVLHKEALRMPVDVVIIDGVPRNTGMSDSAISAADLVIIPVQPSPLDIWATKELVDKVKDAIELREGTDRPLKAAFLINRLVSNTDLGRDVRQALESYGLPVFETAIRQRQEYGKTMARGQTPLDLSPKHSAHEDLVAFKDEVIRFLTNK